MQSKIITQESSVIAKLNNEIIGRAMIVIEDVGPHFLMIKENGF